MRKSIVNSGLKSLLLVALVADGVALRAAEAADKWYASVTCGEQASRDLIVPAATTKEEIVQLLHPAEFVRTDSEAELICAVGIQDWKLGGASIALLETQKFKKNIYGGADSGLVSLYLSIVEQPTKGKPLVIKATLEKPFLLPSEDEEFKSLDTAAYELNDGHFAFGLRTTQHFTYGGGGGANEYLQLFHFEQRQLSPILRTLVGSSSTTAGKWNEDGARDHSENDGGKALLQVLKTKTNSVFNLLKKNKRSKMTFRWDGKKYKTSDKEILVDVNE